jgi:hypothetical protein
LKNAKCREGADIEERLLEFAVRVGKAIDPLLDRRLGRHIAGQLAKPKSSTQEINHELPANPVCKAGMSNEYWRFENAKCNNQSQPFSILQFPLHINHSFSVKCASPNPNHQPKK